MKGFTCVYDCQAGCTVGIYRPITVVVTMLTVHQTGIVYTDIETKTVNMFILSISYVNFLTGGSVY